MKDIHPLRTARRKAKRLAILGTSGPTCALCGIADPMLLRPVKRSFLEQHHVIGKHADPDLTVSLCFNCHAEVTEGLRAAGVTMEKPGNPREFARHVFCAFAVHFEFLSKACSKYARWIEQQKVEE